MKKLLIVVTILTAEALFAQSPPTLEILGRRPMGDDVARHAVVHPRPSIYVLHDDGRPLLSKAGYLQLADSGAGFYYGALVEDRVDWARSIGLIGTNNWGAVEAMCFIGHVVSIWHERHPDIRLGIDEISSRLTGFPDYNHDGISDHLTHQAGMNINLYLPCRKQPEVTIHVGRGRHEELYDAKLFGELIDLLEGHGAYRMTTNAALGLFDDAKRAEHWREVKRTADSYSITYETEKRYARLYLITPKGDHADHVNVLIWKGH